MMSISYSTTHTGIKAYSLFHHSLFFSPSPPFPSPSLSPNVLSVPYCLLPIHLLKAKAFGSSDGKLTVDMIDSGVKEMQEQHMQKVFWEKGSS